MNDVVPSRHTQEPSSRRLLFYFALWTLFAGSVVVYYGLKWRGLDASEVVVDAAYLGGPPRRRSAREASAAKALVYGITWFGSLVLFVGVTRYDRRLNARQQHEADGATQRMCLPCTTTDGPDVEASVDGVDVEEVRGDDVRE